MSYLLQVDVWVYDKNEILAQDIDTPINLLLKLDELFNKHFIRCFKITPKFSKPDTDLIVVESNYEMYEKCKIGLANADKDEKALSYQQLQELFLNIFKKGEENELVQD